MNNLEEQKMNYNNNKRIEWIDIIKFWGIFAIYLGHLGTASGASYMFVYSHHVPLFFVISGCTAALKNENISIQFIVKKAKSLLIPFVIFGTINIFIWILLNDLSMEEAIKMFILLGGGVTGKEFFCAPSLWFLTCLFVMDVIFAVIKKLNAKWVILFVCIGLHLLTIGIINPQMGIPWFFNIDRALYYIIYYAIGYIAFPYIYFIFSNSLNAKIKLLIIITGCFSLFYSTLLFFHKDILSFAEVILWVGWMVPIFRALIVIWTYFIVAYIFRHCLFMAELGKNSLFLCGNEFILKNSIIGLFSIINLNITIVTPLGAWIYCFILIFIAYKWLIPLEKCLLVAIQGNRYR